jgi:hypothetical protein
LIVLSIIALFALLSFYSSPSPFALMFKRTLPMIQSDYMFAFVFVLECTLTTLHIAPHTAMKSSFIATYGGANGYGYDGMMIDKLRHEQFGRLATQGVTYMDHAGSTLYSETQIRTALTALTSTIHANPHSPSSYGAATSLSVERVRQMVLSHLGVTSRTHSLIFTAGATAALKMIGESFPWYCIVYRVAHKRPRTHAM